jgi:hypothetical protein
MEKTFKEVMQLPDGSRIKVLDYSKYALHGTFCYGNLVKEYDSFTVSNCGQQFKEGNKQFGFIYKPNKQSLFSRLKSSFSRRQFAGKTRKQKQTKRRRHRRRN